MSIEIQGLRKSFGSAVAVGGIDLHIPEGQMLVLLGPSGCGKTTTMRCIAGLETPDSGRILIKGKPVYDGAAGIDIPVNRRRVGMVFQSYAIWPHMTVFENVSFSLEMEGVARDEMRERVHAILALVGLDGFAERGASYLSGGQMQRVALARSLVMRPEVLLFDEPLSNLDARLRDHLRVQLREIQTQLNITGVYVTHDQREALALADRIVVMDMGNVLQVGDPVGLYNRPRTSTVAEFLGYSNIFDVGAVERRGEGSVAILKDTGRRLAVSVPVAGVADDLTLCVRPDDIAIAPFPSGDAPAAGIAGEVILASFMGSHMQYRVRTGEKEIWEVLTPKISTDIGLGARVILDISPAHIHLLPRQ